MDLSRRAFITWTGTAFACTCIGTLGVGGCSGKGASDTPPAPDGSYGVGDGHLYVTLAELGPLLNVGGAVKCRVDESGGWERKVIIVRPGDDVYQAFSDACTHNGKELNYHHEEGLLACCGRSSRFDLEGNVVRGPAEDALVRYGVWLEGDQLVVEI
jgi:Rieske Fe-S protein